MRILALMDNIASREDIHSEHGLSLYIETKAGSRILFDMGAGNDFAKNAETLGVDLSLVDVAVLSHGHYDHGGGLGTFLAQNAEAKVYVRETAFRPFWYAKGDRPLRRVGLPDKFEDHPQVVATGYRHAIQDGLSLFSGVPHDYDLPRANAGLMVGEEGKIVPDDFDHEQNLLIEEEGHMVCITGCSHNGIANILEDFKEQHGRYPDALIGGFHLTLSLNPDKDTYRDTEVLSKYLQDLPVRIWTGHCTGRVPFAQLKKRLGDQISYLSGGEEIIFP